MSLYSYFRISKPSKEKVPAEQVDEEYKRLRTRTFWGVTAAYTMYYVCRMTLGVVKQPIIDGGVLSAGELGVIGSVFYFVYAAGKFTNGFIADYCNIRRFMAWGLGVSAVINLILGVLGLLHGTLGIASIVMLVLFALLWGVNGWAQSMGAPPGTISLSRWFPLNKRGTMYSIFSSTPSFGKALTMIATGFIVAMAGWQWGFIAAAIAGVIGTLIAIFFISDTPESKGLPTVQELAGEPLKSLDKKPTKDRVKEKAAAVKAKAKSVKGRMKAAAKCAVAFALLMVICLGATQIIGISEAFGCQRADTQLVFFRPCRRDSRRRRSDGGGRRSGHDFGRVSDCQGGDSGHGDGQAAGTRG